MRQLPRMLSLAMLALAGLTACAMPSSKNPTAEAIRQDMGALTAKAATKDSLDAVNNALLPPLAVNMAIVSGKQMEARFDIAVNNIPASQVFMAIVSGTRYSMLVPPDVRGNISLSLKNVTVFEALEAIRELYGYEYKVDDARIFIRPISMQTRIFQVNYLTGQRAGSSSLRVASGSGLGTAVAGSGQDGSNVSMTSSADFWAELSLSLIAIVGKEEGRSVVISPMSGVIVVRAMPDELKNVAAYLKASQISIERQVILEAKIIEVTLNDGFESGVNWAGFGNLNNSSNSRGSVGALSPGGSLVPKASASIAAIPAAASLIATPAGSLFGLAFQTSNFAALLSFLETQGSVHVLSSPRIATLNNQKAVLKVGTDEFFVTNVSSTTTATTGASTTTPNVTWQPFFSGIALDVTPRIDTNNDIILHVHPSVSLVRTVNKTVSVGGANHTYPLASSSISETDSIVRARDGQIVVIGGLMRQATFGDESGLPGMSKRVFGQTSKRSEKRELIILLKPTVVESDKDWSDDITRSRDRMNGMTR